MTLIKCTATLVLVYCFLIYNSLGFYLPGVAPREYKTGETLLLKADSATSTKTQLAYAYSSLPFCAVNKSLSDYEMGGNLGEVLTGHKYTLSPYEIKMYKDVKCAVVCKTTLDAFSTKLFTDLVERLYLVNMIMDNLPVAYKTVLEDGQKPTTFYSNGFPVGSRVAEKNYLNNHIVFTVEYNIPELEKTTPSGVDGVPNHPPGRIVAVFADAFSVNYKKHKSDIQLNCPGPSASPNMETTPQMISENEEVTWTYSVYWKSSDIKWASRWDLYLNSATKGSNSVHWFSIINSLLIVAFLISMVGMILMRTLRKDLYHYNRIPTDEEKAEEREETGWKLVHGDVFRPPSYPMLFSVTVGTGAQMLFVSIFTITFAALGFLSPANRGSLMIALLLSFMLLGIVAGYYSACTYKMFNGAHWQRCTILTATFYPGCIATIVFFLNLIVWAEGSSRAIPFGSMLAVLSLWFFISVPLTFLGAFYGYKRDAYKHPVRTHEIPRTIPPQPWYLSPLVNVVLGGILPFGTIFVEMFCILNALYLDAYFYLYGFLFMVFLILIVTCGEITIVLIYFQLCGEDYCWWWRSLLTSGSLAFFVFAYSVLYFFQHAHVVLFATTTLFFGYNLLIALVLFLATSVIGYFSSYWFIAKIFGSIKVD